MCILINIKYFYTVNFNIYFYIAIAKELEFADISYCGIGPDIVHESKSYHIFDKDPDVSAVIVGFDEHFSYPKMLKAATYLNDPNVHFIGTNTDERFPTNCDFVIPGMHQSILCIYIYICSHKIYSN